ncbi:hypothetical protein J5277_09725 [Rhizobium sp. 16-449-1b]|uniref:hypothetical protein n=1 Tax=Rhizobium sp. 16-449-1b TaxID=2819989 RepID=UPI001ADA39C1|nr:hypothetical protein [Rhizobium sp. 16-449-1b]MBO9194384.1 hypothetical protein [Rhizobium sp. 16-449-1b]
MEKVTAKGLKWIKRPKGVTPYWVADDVAIKGGFRPKNVNLSHMRDEPMRIVAKCNQLQGELELWKVEHKRDPTQFDGTIASVLTAYEQHEDSPYLALKPGSLVPYKHYLARLRGHIGSRHVSDINGVDIIRWHREWSEDGKHLAAAEMARAVLMAALSFGVMLRSAGTSDLLSILRETNRKLPKPRSRKESLTAEQVATLRAAAHASGRPSRALAYAIAFETTLRLWDVIGQWWPLDKGGVSDIIDAKQKKKWFGLRWEDISEDLVLSYIPSKTRFTTEKRVFYPLSDAPMVLEELKHWPVEKRSGPVIVLESTGLPYHATTMTMAWNLDKKNAGITTKVWARDLRASGITEGRASAVAADDVAKVAGHSSREMVEEIYDRTTIEAAERFAKGRKERRETKR